MEGVRGWTLIELLTVVAILTISVTVAVPAMQDMVARDRRAATVNRLVGALHRARSEAVERGMEAVACKSADGYTCTVQGTWAQGWIVFTDPNSNEACPNADGDGRCDDDGGRVVLVQGPAALGHVAIRTTGGNVSRLVAYRPEGFSWGYPGRFSVCTADGGGRAVILSMTGRIRLSSDPADVDC